MAEVAGGDWPERGAAAFAKLTGASDTEAQGVGVMLLSDIRAVFSERDVKRMFSKTLVAALIAMRDHPWPEAHRGREISETWLARKLASFGITPTTLRIGDDRAKGYATGDFADVFARFLTPEAQSKRDSVTSQAGVDGIDYQSRDAEKACHASESHKAPANIELSPCHVSKAPPMAQQSELVEELV